MLDIWRQTKMSQSWDNPEREVFFDIKKILTNKGIFDMFIFHSCREPWNMTICCWPHFGGPIWHIFSTTELWQPSQLPPQSAPNAEAVNVYDLPSQPYRFLCLWVHVWLKKPEKNTVALQIVLVSKRGQESGGSSTMEKWQMKKTRERKKARMRLRLWGRGRMKLATMTQYMKGRKYPSLEQLCSSRSGNKIFLF